MWLLSVLKEEEKSNDELEEERTIRLLPVPWQTPGVLCGVRDLLWRRKLTGKSTGDLTGNAWRQWSRLVPKPHHQQRYIAGNIPSNGGPRLGGGLHWLPYQPTPTNSGNHFNYPLVPHPSCQPVIPLFTNAIQLHCRLCVTDAELVGCW